MDSESSHPRDNFPEGIGRPAGLIVLLALVGISKLVQRDEFFGGNVEGSESDTFFIPRVRTEDNLKVPKGGE